MLLVLIDIESENERPLPILSEAFCIGGFASAGFVTIGVLGFSSAKICCVCGEVW